jgi:hypothetical protein
MRMSDLGDLLELMHTADERWTTIRIEGREWSRPELLTRAFLRAADRSRSATYGGGPDEEPSPAERRSRWRLRVAKPGRVRAEFDVGGEEVTTLVHGDTAWAWSSSRPVQTGPAKPGTVGMGPGGALLHPWSILAWVDLRPTGTTVVAGRSALRAVATSFRTSEEGPEAFLSQHELGAGADEHELAIDGERGILLRAEARVAGEMFRIIEVERVEFDVQLPDDVFAPPPTRPTVPIPRPVSMELHEVPAVVPFAVFVPERPPSGSYPPNAMIDHPDPVSGNPLTLHIGWNTPPEDGRGGRSHDNLTVMEAPEPLPEIRGVRWSDVGDLRIGTDRHGFQSITRIRVVIGGTHVELSSDDIGPDRLLGYARSLVRLPGEPPGLVEPGSA